MIPNFCTHCSADISELAVRNFCPMCGKPVNRMDGRRGNSGRPKNKTYAFQSIPESIAQEYRDGASGSELAGKHGTNMPAVYKRLRELGVEIRRPGYKTLKRSASSTADILQRHAAGEPLADIGKRHGITRERVRQIAAAHQLPARSEVRRPELIQRAFDRLARKEDARVQRIARFKDFSELWKSGASVETIAEAMQMTPRGVTQFAVYNRQRHPDMFPMRRAPNGSVAKRVPLPHCPTLHDEARKLIESSEGGFSADTIWQQLRDHFPTQANRRNLSNLFWFLKKDGLIEVVKEGGRRRGCSTYRKASAAAVGV